MERIVRAHFRLIPPEPCKRRIVLSFGDDNQARRDIILSTGQAALLAVEIEQALGEAMRHSRAPGVKRRLSLKFPKHMD